MKKIAKKERKDKEKRGCEFPSFSFFFVCWKEKKERVRKRKRLEKERNEIIKREKVRVFFVCERKEEKIRKRKSK